MNVECNSANQNCIQLNLFILSYLFYFVLFLIFCLTYFMYQNISYLCCSAYGCIRLNAYMYYVYMFTSLSICRITEPLKC